MQTNVERNIECDCNIWVNYTSREDDSPFQELEETCETYGEDSTQRSNVPLSFSKDARRFNRREAAEIVSFIFISFFSFSRKEPRGK